MMPDGPEGSGLMQSLYNRTMYIHYSCQREPILDDDWTMGLWKCGLEFVLDCVVCLPSFWVTLAPALALDLDRDLVHACSRLLGVKPPRSRVAPD